MKLALSIITAIGWFFRFKVEELGIFLKGVGRILFDTLKFFFWDMPRALFDTDSWKNSWKKFKTEIVPPTVFFLLLVTSAFAVVLYFRYWYTVISGFFSGPFMFFNGKETVLTSQGWLVVFLTICVIFIQGWIIGNVIRVTRKMGWTNNTPSQT
jgi:hypothetical protein